MKQLLIIIGIIFLTFQLKAQLSGIGLGLGGNFSGFDYGNQTNSITDFESEDQLGGTGGIRFDFNLISDSEVVKFSPEVFVIQNGSREFFNDLSLFVERRIRLDYVGLYLPVTLYFPMDAGYGPSVGYGVEGYTYNGILISARGFFDYVLDGQIIDDFNTESEIQFNKTLDKLDVGYSISMGFVLNGAFLLLGYDKGIKNIIFESSLGNQEDENYLLQNRGFNIKVGYIHKLN